MSAQDWLVYLGLGALLGATGQGARVVVGLKKLADEAAARSQSLADAIRGNQLLVSLLIGAIAGMLAAHGLSDNHDPDGALTYATLTALIAAGYAGPDFIEGFMQRSGKGGG